MEIIRAAVIIKKDDKFLLVQEGSPAVRGLWCWSQGRVEEGETVEETAAREAKEEVGFDVTLVRKLQVIENPYPCTKEIHVFLGEILGGELRINEGEILQAKWFTLEEISLLKDQAVGLWICETISSI